MSVRRFIVLSLVTAGALVGCNKSSDAPPPFNQNLSSAGGSAALPISASSIDRGILKDQAGYQAAGGGPRGAGMTGSERDQVQALVDTLIKAGSKNDASAMLDALVPEDAAVLKEEADTLFATLDKAKGLEATLIGKFGKEAVEQFGADETKKAIDAIRIEVQDADNATVTPNIMAGFLGPTKAGANMAVKRVEGNWKVALGLSAADAKQIAAFHHVLQAALDTVTKQVESGEITALDQLSAAEAKAAVGALAGGAAEGEKSPTSAESAEKPDADKPAAESQPAEEPKPEGEDDVRDIRRRPSPEDEARPPNP